jgi:hypothetical protein
MPDLATQEHPLLQPLRSPRPDRVQPDRRHVVLIRFADQLMLAYRGKLDRPDPLRELGQDRGLLAQPPMLTAPQVPEARQQSPRPHHRQSERHRHRPFDHRRQQQQSPHRECCAGAQ